MTQGNTPHRAAVITPDTIWYGNGVALPAQPGLGHNLRQVLDGTSGRFAQHATVVIDGVRPHAVADQSADLRDAGWAHTRIDAWTLFHRDDGRTVAVGLRDVMTTKHLGVLFDRDTDPGVLALNLDRYHQATGNAWRGTCATTALNAIRLSWGNNAYQPLWNQRRLPLRNNVGKLDWKRPLNDNERWWGFVHTFDGNNAYLGSAITAELAWSQLHHQGPQPFDHTLPGYWLLELDTATLAMMADPGRPPLLGKMRGTQAWVTTPYARFLRDLGDRCDVIDSWTARAELRASGSRLHPAGARILRSWGESVRDGLGRVPQAVETAVKRTYKDAVGGMQRESMRINRTDWAETIIDLWRATLYRKVLKVHQTCGVWPVRWATDSVSYADSSADPGELAKALGCRAGLGGMHHEETLTTEQWLARHETTQRGGRHLRSVKKDAV